MMDTNTLLDAVAEIVREQVSDLRRDAERQINEACAAADAANQRAEKLSQDLEAAVALALEQRPSGITEDDVSRAVEAAVSTANESHAEAVQGIAAAAVEHALGQIRSELGASVSALGSRLGAIEASLSDAVTAEQARAFAAARAADVEAALAARLEDVERRLAGMHGAAERFDEKLAALEARPQGMPQESVRQLAESAARDAEVRAGEAAELAVDALDSRLDALEKKVGAVTEVSESRALEATLEFERLAKGLDGVQEEVGRAQEKAARAPDAEFIEQRLDTLKARISIAEDQVAERVREIADAQDQIKLTNGDVVSKAITQMRSSVHGAEAWRRGGAGYQKFSVVRHRGALWQTPVETGEEPGRGDDWALLADGVRDVRTSVSDDGVFTLAIDTASGQTSEAQFQLPKVNFVGAYDKAATYEKWDAVVRDCHTFLALKDDPGEVGNGNGGWMTIGYRGKAGKRGPTLNETCDELRPGVVRALMGEMPEMVSTAVQALAGSE